MWKQAAYQHPWDDLGAYLYPLHSSQAGIVESSAFDKSLLGSDLSTLTSERVVCFIGGRASQAPPAVESVGATSCQEVPSWSGDFVFMHGSYQAIHPKIWLFDSGC